MVVKTSRTGLGRKAGHDLTIEVTRWSGEVVVDNPDQAPRSVSATIEVDSLEVREGVGGLKPLTDSDREEIRKTMRQKILHPAEHPTITFQSTEVTGTAESFVTTGDLTIMGKTHPVTINASMEDGRVRGGTTLSQSRWGIKPYSAFLGALRLADEVEVEFELTAPQ